VRTINFVIAGLIIPLMATKKNVNPVMAPENAGAIATYKWFYCYFFGFTQSCLTARGVKAGKKHWKAEENNGQWGAGWIEEGGTKHKQCQPHRTNSIQKLKHIFEHGFCIKYYFGNVGNAPFRVPLKPSIQPTWGNFTNPKGQGGKGLKVLNVEVKLGNSFLYTENAILRWFIMVNIVQIGRQKPISIWGKISVFFYSNRDIFSKIRVYYTQRHVTL
jgi:hypothetical protein